MRRKKLKLKKLPEAPDASRCLDRDNMGGTREAPDAKVTDAAEWASLSTGAYCYYNNDSATYAATYGKLYNWYVVNDPRGLAPEGWHVCYGFWLNYSSLFTRGNGRGDLS